MKKYEVPAFNNRSCQSDKRRFDHPTQGMDSGKSKFEPAYLNQQKKSQQPKDNQLVEAKETKEDSLREPKQTTQQSGLEHYEIPFLKKQNKQTTSLNTQQSLEETQSSDDETSTVVSNWDATKPSLRSNYEPSFKKQVANTHEVQDEEEQIEDNPFEERPFKATELPKPYKKQKLSNRQVDENTRLLAKRLQKSKNNFLLFED